MEFVDFCKLHGIIVNRPPRLGKWERYPTEDHPKTKNGAVKFMGDYGFAKNHAVDLEVGVWRAEGLSKASRMNFSRAARNSEEETRRAQEKAASKAKWILSQTELKGHPYLIKKGFPDELGNIWKTVEAELLVIPMRSDDRIVGCQLIDADGSKRFLTGQRTSGAEFVFKGGGNHILCEGYATALSIRAALKVLRMTATVRVCFSAHNMVKVAAGLRPGFVVADNDKPNPRTGKRAGLEAAQAIGWPYWISEKEPEDANDTHIRLGLFRFSQAIRPALQSLGG